MDAEDQPTIEVAVKRADFPYPCTNIRMNSPVWERETFSLQIEHWGWTYTVTVLKAPPLSEVQKGALSD